jgi:GNAT superfamily N-acetyltransferase
MEWHRDGFSISDGPERVDTDVVVQLLAETYWGHKRPRPVVEKLIPNSFCFSLFQNGEQIGFARVVTDFTVFSWLSDLVVHERYRRRGLGGWFLNCILNHPKLSRTQFVLQTTYAHDMYKKFGFQGSEKILTRLPGPPSE